MELRQLRCFVAVCEELSFSRAAQRSYLSQSAVSSQVARLEHELDVALFDRTTRSVAVTEEGQRLLPIARQMLQLEELAYASVQPDVARVRLAANMSFANRAMVAIAVMREAHPDTEVDFIIRDFGARLASVRNGDVDLALIRGSLPREHEVAAGVRLAVQSLWSEDLAVVVSQKHPLARHESVSLADLSRYPLLLPPRAQQRLLRVVVEQAFDAARVPLQWGPPIAIDRTAVAELVNHPDAWTVLYSGEMTPGVTALPMRGDPLQIEVGAVTRADHPPNPLVSQLVDELCAVAVDG